MSETKWTQLRTITLAATVAVVPSGLAIALASKAPPELRGPLYAGAVTLTFGGLLGGVLKVLLDDFAATRRKREDAATFVTNVLSDLKAVYDRVGRARILIPAHQSAKTYGSEMRDLIEARVQLRNVMRALEHRAEGILETQRTSIVGNVKSMEEYLEGLSSEFRLNYKPVADSQRTYEARLDASLKKAAQNQPNVTIRNTPWELLTSSKFPLLMDLIGEGEGREYRQKFEKPLDDASETLREELARIVGGRVRAASGDARNSVEKRGSAPS